MTEKYKQHSEYSNDEIKAALQKCADEPIHIPGSIQPYGAMAILEKDTSKIVGVSENFGDYLNISESILGKDISKVIGNTNKQKIQTFVNSEELKPIRSTRITINNQDYDCNAHISGEFLVFEFESVDNEVETKDDSALYDDLRTFSLELREANNLQDLYNTVTKNIKELTGYDRVMLYQFDKDWNGEIVSEKVDDHYESFLGLKYPATDIPAQARALYEKSYIRIISDIAYQPSEIIGLQEIESRLPIDMTHSVLRSVSPIHLQYLSNMGVCATMTISIIQNGKLWGLIACHNMSPKYVPYKFRMICELMGHTFSSLLSSFNEIETKEAEQDQMILIEKLESSLNLDIDIREVFEKKLNLTLRALKANCVCFKGSGKTITFSENEFPEPDEECLVKLTKFLHRNYKNSIFNTDDFSHFITENNLDFEMSFGVLAIPISIDSPEYIIWFREPEVETINWAGSKDKNLQKTDDGLTLLPRNSFKKWQEIVAQKSKPWTKHELELAAKVARLILEHEKKSAELANLAKTNFLTDMSHELRTPMNAIVGVANILNKDDSLSDEQKKFVKTLMVSSDNLLDLINDLLDLAKIEDNKLSTNMANMSISDLLENVRSVMHMKAAEKDIDLNIRISKGTDVFYGDEIRIRQIIMNLVSNAIKFTHDGFVQINAKIDNDELKITVQDTGIGMTEKQLERVFEKFSQATSETSSKYGGTGLGLSISSALADLMGGKIDAVSQEGFGSKFTLILPNKADAENIFEEKEVITTSHQVQPIKNDKTQFKKRALLAEDYDGNVVIATYFLEDLGFETVVAANGQEAIEKMKDNEFDIVLMDVQMPVMDGLEATRIIRDLQSKDALYKCPVIGMTAHAFIGSKNKCIESGMDGYISKPFTFADLKNALTKYI